MVEVRNSASSGVVVNVNVECIFKLIELFLDEGYGIGKVGGGRFILRRWMGCYVMLYVCCCMRGGWVIGDLFPDWFLCYLSYDVVAPRPGVMINRVFVG